MDGRQGCLDSLASTLVWLTLLSLSLSVLIVIVACFLAAAGIFLLLRFLTIRYVMPQLYPATAVFAEQRLFGAPPDSQWFSAYDYWLMCLEQATGLTFTQSPSQLLIGSIMISLAPALVIGLPLAVLVPAAGGCLLAGLTAAGLVVGAVTGQRLGQPMPRWFGPMNIRGRLDSGQDEGGFSLGDEQW